MSRPPTPDLRDSVETKSSAYRKYQSAVDRVVATFDNIESWPDNISFLNRLLKTIQSNPTMPLPRSFEVSHCLALCLVPKLPSGVQQKALELYSYIFSSRQTLERDLDIFMIGLTPVLGYASTTLKATCITLFSTFLVPLGPNLVPFSRGLILALLPALEDEHDESFDACLCLVDEIRLALQDEISFWNSFWIATITATSSSRAGSLNYLLCRMPKSSPACEADTETCTGDGVVQPCLGADSGLLTRAFATGLTDTNVLVQRGFLELLVTRLPLSSAIVIKFPSEQKRLLLMAASQIVLRRDVSLNRRLWSWLLSPSDEGTTKAPDSSILHFRKYAEQDLQAALLAGAQSEPVKINRLLLSFLDRHDIGGQIIDAVFPAVMHTTYINQSTGEFLESMTSFKALFEAVPIDIIFTYLRLLCSQESFEEARFILEQFNLAEEEVILGYLPGMFVHLLICGRDDHGALELAHFIMSQLSTVALKAEVQAETWNDDHESPKPGSAALTTWYDLSINTSELSNMWPALCFAAMSTTAEDLSTWYQILLRRFSLGEINEQLIDMAITYVTEVVQRDGTATILFEHVQGSAEIVFVLLKNSAIAPGRLRAVCARLCEHCWNYLGPTKLRFEISSVLVLSKLCSLLPVKDAEAFICSHVSQALRTDNPIGKFAALWTHLEHHMSKALLHRSTLLILDTLAYDQSSAHSYIVRWIRSSAQSAPRIIESLWEAIAHHLPCDKRITRPLQLECTTRIPDEHHDLNILHYDLKLANQLLIKVGGKYLMTLQDNNEGFSEIIAEGVQTESSGPLDCLAALQYIALFCLEIDLGVEQEHLALSIAEECISILRLVSHCRELEHSPEPILSQMLALAVERRHFDVQHLILSASQDFMPGIEGRHSMSSTFIIGLTEGIRRARNHPILQDYLEYLHIRINLRDVKQQETLLTFMHCIVEQIDLNLIDIDAALTTNNFVGEMTTAHENITLFLNSLENMSVSALHVDSKTQVVTTAKTHPSFLNVALSSVIGPEHDHNRTAITGTFDATSWPIQDIVKVSSGVWLWAANNSGSDLPSVVYMSNMFENRSRNLLGRLVKLNAAFEVLDIVIQQWVSSSLRNRVSLEQLSRLLLGADVISALCHNIRSKLSFSIAVGRSFREQLAEHSMLFALSTLKDCPSDDFIQPMQDVTALLRHLTMHIPLTNHVNVTLMRLTCLLSSKLLSTSIGQQKKHKREISDSVSKIIITIIAGGETEQIDSGLAGVLIADIIPDLAQIFRDLDRSATILSTIMTQLIQPQIKTKTVSFVALDLLEAICMVENMRKIWKKDVQDFFADPAFFNMPSTTSKQWLNILRKLISSDKERINEYLVKANSSNPGSLFASAESERQFKIGQNCRLIMLLLAMPRDAFLASLQAIQDRFKDLLHNKPVLRVEALSCLQAILMRFSFVHLQNFWPTMIAELQSIFLHLLELSLTDDMNIQVLASALQTLDLLLYLSPDEFQSYVSISHENFCCESNLLRHIWLFIDDTYDGLYCKVGHDSRSSMSRLAKKTGVDQLQLPFKPLLSIGNDVQQMTLAEYIKSIGALYHERLYHKFDSHGDVPLAETALLQRLFSH